MMKTIPQFPVQMKVATGFWNLVRVERRTVCFVGIRYVPRYRFQPWNHREWERLVRLS